MQAKFNFFHPPKNIQSKKLIVFIGNPRSYTTIPVRAWAARGDGTVIMNEIGICAYNQICADQQKPELTEELFAGGIKTFPEVAETISNELKNNPVFIKDTVFAAKHYLTETFEPVYSENTYFFFLLRDIADCMLSNYKILNMSIDNNLQDAWSYKDMWDLFKRLASCNPNTFIIDSLDLVNNPTATMQDICSKVGVPYLEKSLLWQPMKITDRLGPYCGFVPQWQDNITASSGIDATLCHTAQRLETGDPSFQEIAPEHRESFVKFYNQQNPYYLQMRESFENRSTAAPLI